jgi:PIN domain nuclease of toxin-antitoxin system
VIVADTHALVWWFLARHELSAKALQTLDDNPVAVAGVSCFEVARLTERGRIELGINVLDWLDSVFALPQVVLLPLTIDVAVTAARLPEPVRDPIDRIIVATALHQGVPLVTKDRKIVEAGIVTTIW